MLRRRTYPGIRTLALLASLVGPSRATAGDEATGAVIESEFLFAQAPFASCHASTIAETPAGLVAAWFGGTDEGRPDVGIWLARRDRGGWSDPVKVAEGRQPDGRRVACWNPVLAPGPGHRLRLFYKVGPSPRAWWGMVMSSGDDGRTWDPPARLPEGFLGPIKNKPVTLADGALLCPSSTEDQGWRVHLERLGDGASAWTKVGPLNDGKAFGAIQPTILTHPGGVLEILCRGTKGRILESWSRDGGTTWEPLRPSSLPNPNSGIDAVTLADGRALLVYNHTAKGRSPLNIAVSEDGEAWHPGPVLEHEPGEYSYPAVIQGTDGRVHATYTWNRRRIKHAVIDPAKLDRRGAPPR